MTDDEIFALLESGKEYSREEIGKLVGSATKEDEIYISRVLGRLKRWDKIKKTDKGTWLVLAKPTSQPATPAEAAQPQNPPPSIYDALLRVQAKINGTGVDRLEDKLYTLDFLGKLLDPSINEIFESIAGDLKRLEGK